MTLHLMLKLLKDVTFSTKSSEVRIDDVMADRITIKKTVVTLRFHSQHPFLLSRDRSAFTGSSK